MNEQSANIGIATLADPSKVVLPPVEFCREPDQPGGEIPRFPELADLANRGNQRRRSSRPDPRIV